MKIPVLDLSPVRQRIAGELERRWQAILESNAYVLGPEVRELESLFKDFLDAEACLAVGNGTDALTIALRALGVEPGDEVIVPGFGFFATAEAVLVAGGRPILVDVQETTLNLDPKEVARHIGERTVGIIPVHLYGRPCPMNELLELARKHDLFILEDAAQAHGARYRGRRVGTFGQLAAWSFYPSKNLGCFGDGGAITAGDPGKLEEARLLANHGQVGRYSHTRIGANSRMDSLQAAVLNSRLPYLDQDNQHRRNVAALYRDALEGVGDVVLLEDDPEDEPVYHQFTLRSSRRDELQAFLAESGIGSVIHYPQAQHRIEPLARELASIPELPVSEAAAQQVLCLPIHPHLAMEDAGEVATTIRRFFGI